MTRRAILCLAGVGVLGCLLLLCGIALVHRWRTQAPQRAGVNSPLSAEDRELLERLFKEGLFDPAGRLRIRVRGSDPLLSEEDKTFWREGWLVGDKDTPDTRIAFCDGETLPIGPGEAMEPVDYLAESRQRLAVRRDPDRPRNRGFTNKDYDLEKLGYFEDPDLARAAWLYRLNEPILAADFLEEARKDRKDPRQWLRLQLARSKYLHMARHYLWGNDREALKWGGRLTTLYPDELPNLPQAEELLHELKRRGKREPVARRSPFRPDDFDELTPDAKLSFLVAALEDIEPVPYRWSQWREVTLDWRYKELILLGEKAVPALIEVIANDTRLTRWGDHPVVLRTADVAFEAVQEVLRLREFEEWQAHPASEAQKTAARLRRYWSRYSALPFDARQVKVLTDPDAAGKTKRDAAVNLGHLDDIPRWMTPPEGVFARTRGPHPCTRKFTEPTAAEAILVALDQDLAAHDAGPEPSEWERGRIEIAYFFALIRLRDVRIGPECRERWRTEKNPRTRRRWAFLCCRLGVPEPLKQLADEFRTGALVLPQKIDDARTEFRETVRTLAESRLPEADTALFALAEPSHPWHQRVVAELFARGSAASDAADWFAHPFSLLFLRRALTNTDPTGWRWRVEGRMVVGEAAQGIAYVSLPRSLRDSTDRVEPVEERVCDVAATHLGELVVGLPAYHLLQNDSETRLKTIRRVLDQFGGRLRRLSPDEGIALGRSFTSNVYAPDIPPLRRAATEEDVKAGRAVFHLVGKGRPAAMRLPAVGVRKGQPSERVWIVQAEVTPNGEVIYGVLGEDGMSHLGGAEVGDICHPPTETP